MNGFGIRVGKSELGYVYVKNQKYICYDGKKTFELQSCNLDSECEIEDVSGIFEYFKIDLKHNRIRVKVFDYGISYEYLDEEFYRFETNGIFVDKTKRGKIIIMCMAKELVSRYVGCLILEHDDRITWNLNGEVVRDFIDVWNNAWSVNEIYYDSKYEGEIKGIRIEMEECPI